MKVLAIQLCAAKPSILGDVTLEFQTLVSKINKDDFDLSVFLLQVVELSDRTQKLASDLSTEALKLLQDYQQTLHFDCDANKEDDLIEHDPEKRPENLSENEKKYLISLGPCQPRLSSFPKKDEGSKKSKFSASWYSEFPHLEYSISNDAAYCFKARGSSVDSFDTDVFFCSLLLIS